MAVTLKLSMQDAEYLSKMLDALADALAPAADMPPVVEATPRYDRVAFLKAVRSTLTTVADAFESLDYFPRPTLRQFLSGLEVAEDIEDAVKKTLCEDKPSSVVRADRARRWAVAMHAMPFGFDAVNRRFVERVSGALALASNIAAEREGV